MLFAIIALILCIAVLAFDLVCAARATNPLPWLVLFVTVPAAAGVLLALGAVGCAVWWPPGAIWLAIAACMGTGPTLLLWGECALDGIRDWIDGWR